MYNPFTLNEKTILITGASGGIGQSVAIECSKFGARLVITGRNKERLNETYNNLDGSNHIQIQADLSKKNEIDDLVDNLPELNGVCHCAGITNPVPVKFIDQEKLDEIFSVNFFSAIIITKEIIKRKLLQREASIVFISSISGVHVSSPGGTLYSATKGAINGAVKGIALDLAGRGIRVNSICPGMIKTKLITDGVLSEEDIDRDLKKYPLKRYGNPEEVAYAVIYLLSDTSKWITGTNLTIDGGYTLS